MTSKTRMNLEIDPDVAARFREICESAGLFKSVVVESLLRTAIENGDIGAPANPNQICPYSDDRLREMLYVERKSVAEIAILAKEVMDWPFEPSGATVQAWITSAGLAINRQRLALPKGIKINRQVSIPGGFKHCSRCKSTKTTDNFFKDKSRSDGYGSYCKDCMQLINSERSKKYYAKNIEAMRERARAYKLSKKNRANAV